MLTFNKTTFFILVFGNENLSAIDRVTDRKPEQTFCALEAFFFCQLIDLLGIEYSFGNLLERPTYNSCLWLYGSDELFTSFVCTVNVSDGCQSHVAAFFPCPAHTVYYIQCSSVILNFGRSK